ncbi:MAG: glycosyltransferase [Hyphomicrobiales bacterium]|nr:glycosyltransferase [Hyphomicrobiales bacterium]MDE2018129.1 glycosyltransferase [Hyphomicrobiales bacterium]
MSATERRPGPPRLLGVHRLHHRKGGAEAVHLDHLALFRARGWDCAEFAMEHPDNEPSPWAGHFADRFEQPRGLQALRAAPRFFHSAKARQGMARLLDAFRPDVIHVHGLYHQLTPSVVAPAVDRGIPITFTLHDFKLICPAYHFYNPRIGVCEKCAGGRQWNCLFNRCTGGSLAKDALYALDGAVQWRRRTVRDAVARFVGPSRFIVEKFAEHGFARETLRYVPNFFESADDSPVDPARVDALRREAGPHVLYFGRLSPEKGLVHLIDAAAVAGARLAFVGDGPQRAELEARAKTRGAKATFTGHLKGAELWARVEAATVVALPSAWYENAPKSVLEAQARGKAVVTTRIGGLPELVEDGATGFLAAPGDAASLAEALSRALGATADELAKMGALARERVNGSFNKERYYREMTEVYREVSPAIAALNPKATDG